MLSDLLMMMWNCSTVELTGNKIFFILGQGRDWAPQKILEHILQVTSFHLLVSLTSCKVPWDPGYECYKRTVLILLWKFMLLTIGNFIACKIGTSLIPYNPDRFPVTLGSTRASGNKVSCPKMMSKHWPWQGLTLQPWSMHLSHVLSFKWNAFQLHG